MPRTRTAVYISTNLTNKAKTRAAYYANFIMYRIITYPSRRGSFAIFIANNRVRDG